MFVIQVYAGGVCRVRREFDDKVVARREFAVMVENWRTNDYATLVALEWEAELFKEVDGDVVSEIDSWDHREHPDAPEPEEDD